MKIIALDDEPLALRLLRNYVARTSGLLAEGFFSMPARARERLAQGDIDLLFLDVNMPDINGLNFFKSLETPPMVVFTTAHAQYAVDGFELEAVDFLLKPIEYERFAKSVGKAKEFQAFLESKKTSTDSPENTAADSLVGHIFFVKSGYGLVKIAIAELLFVEAMDDYVRFHLTHGRPVMSRMSLRVALENLPADGRFLQVHRSFVVAMDKITGLRARKITIGSREIPVGDRYWESVAGKLGF